VDRIESGESLDALKGQAKKLSARAMNCKMELHDLSEELPLQWERIPEVSAQAFEAFQQLTALRKRIAALGG
jgi:hypothetical protein